MNINYKEKYNKYKTKYLLFGSGLTTKNDLLKIYKDILEQKFHIDIDTINKIYEYEYNKGNSAKFAQLIFNNKIKNLIILKFKKIIKKLNKNKELKILEQQLTELKEELTEELTEELKKELKEELTEELTEELKKELKEEIKTLEEEIKSLEEEIKSSKEELKRLYNNIKEADDEEDKTTETSVDSKYLQEFNKKLHELISTKFSYKELLDRILNIIKSKIESEIESEIEFEIKSALLQKLENLREKNPSISVLLPNIYTLINMLSPKMQIQILKNMHDIINFNSDKTSSEDNNNMLREILLLINQKIAEL